jgi:hypothetical protein
MAFERVHRSRSQTPQTSWSTSQFAPRPFPVQEPKRPPTIPRTVFGAAPETRILPLEFVPRRKLKPAFYRW